MIEPTPTDKIVRALLQRPMSVAVEILDAVIASRVADEREACARACEEQCSPLKMDGGLREKACAARIRARTK
jgi:hypothetical protein